MARILIIEDEALIAISLAMTFEAHGHEVRTVGDGIEALAALAAFQPELVVSDYSLPRLGGAELLRSIEARARTPAGGYVPLVVLTAYDEAKLRQDGAPCDVFLRKPVSEDHVVDIAHRLIGRTPGAAR